MNRIGFMTQLAALLQDVPVEERREAMQYYNDILMMPEQKEPPRTSNTMKIILIIAIILVGGPVLIPLALGFVALVAGCLIALVAVFASIVVMTVSAVIAGVV